MTNTTHDTDEHDMDHADASEMEESIAAPARSNRPRRPDVHAHDHDHDHDETTSDDEDPAWWVPHAALSTLVLVGVLGFFGAFNKALGRFVPRPLDFSNVASEAVPAHKPAASPPPHAAPVTAAEQPRETFGAKHLLVMYAGSRRAPPAITRSKDEARARAQEAMGKAKAGVKFEELVSQYSDEPSAGTRGGDLGVFPKGAMVPEFQAALEKIKVNEVSAVVETPFGFHVIKRTK